MMILMDNEYEFKYYIFCIYMGVYRSEPDTEKHTLKGSSGKISFCSVEMQGMLGFEARLEEKHGARCHPRS